MPTKTVPQIIHQRLDSHHWTTLSSDGKKTYNQIFDEILKRWRCDCPDARPMLLDESGFNVLEWGGNNPLCKHRISLVLHIDALEKQQQALVLRQASEIVEKASEEGFSDGPPPPTIEDTHKLADQVRRVLDNVAEDVDEQSQSIFEIETLVNGLRKDRNEQAQTIQQLFSVVTEQSEQIALLQERLTSAEETIKGLVAVTEDTPLIDAVIEQIQDQVATLATKVTKLEKPIVINAEHIRISQPRAAAKPQTKKHNTRKNDEISEDEAFEILRKQLLEVAN